MEQRSRAALARSGETLFWVEDLVAESGAPYRLKISYPERFPHEPPKAFVVWPDIKTAPHRFSDGSLCLFDRPSASGVKTTALVVRNRAVAWFLAYEIWRATGEWMAPQH